MREKAKEVRGETEARLFSLRTPTRLLAALGIESLLLVWRLYNRTLRPAARYLFLREAYETLWRAIVGTGSVNTTSIDTGLAQQRYQFAR